MVLENSVLFDMNSSHLQLAHDCSYLTVHNQIATNVISISSSSDFKSDQTLVKTRFRSVAVSFCLFLIALILSMFLCWKKSALDCEQKAKKVNYKCVFWNFTLNQWDTSGCNYTSVKKDVHECNCNHMTSFAVLMVSNNLCGFEVFLFDNLFFSQEFGRNATYMWSLRLGFGLCNLYWHWTEHSRSHTYNPCLFVRCLQVWEILSSKLNSNFKSLLTFKGNSRRTNRTSTNRPDSCSTTMWNCWLVCVSTCSWWTSFTFCFLGLNGTRTSLAACFAEFCFISLCSARLVGCFALLFCNICLSTRYSLSLTSISSSLPYSLLVNPFTS